VRAHGGPVEAPTSAQLVELAKAVAKELDEVA
jgi:hypothetical protein